MVKDSIIIPIYNGKRYLPIFWQTLFNNLTSLCELIVIDDASTEDVKSTIPKEYKNFDFKFIRNEKNLGYAATVNRAIKMAKGEFLYLLNTDLIFRNDTLSEIKNLLVSNPSIGIVGTKLFYPQTNRIQHFGVAFSETRKLHLYTHMSANNPILSENLDVQAVTFALVGLRKTTIDEIGYLDDKYYNGCEDIDYSLRVKNAGYKLVVSSKAIAFHWESQSGTARHISTPDNEARFWSVWGSKIKIDYLSYLEKNIKNYFKKNTIPSSRILIVNLATSQAPTKVVNKVVSCFDTDCEIMDFSNSNNSKFHLWLPMILPLEMIRTNLPIIYIVDELPQLLQNSYWFSVRNEHSKNDFIIDQYMNLVDLNELDSMLIPSKLKCENDVS